MKIVLDKTGTITQGKPTVTDYLVVNNSDRSESELLGLVAAVERNSEHPLAEAIVKYARSRDIKLAEVLDFKAIAGSGVRGTVLNHWRC